MNLQERIKYAQMKARHSRRLRPWYKKWWGVIVLILAGLVLIILIASVAYVISRTHQIITGQNPAPTAAETQQYLQEINGTGNNYWIGTSTPLATIVEFGDFSCPHCRDSYPVINQLAKTYPDKIKIIWRDYLINSNSIDLAMSARCAGEQGKFWQMHNALFANQDQLITNDAQRPAKLIALAKSLGLNVTQFTSCLSNEKYVSQIKQDYNDGNALQIPGTPTWYVNNREFSGYIPFNQFNTLISGLIKLKIGNNAKQ